MQVVRQRQEFKTHTFDLPVGVKADSEEAEAIYDDFDWGDESIEHASEENLQVIQDHRVVIIDLEWCGDQCPFHEFLPDHGSGNFDGFSRCNKHKRAIPESCNRRFPDFCLLPNKDEQ